MKYKLFTFFLALVASIGTTSAWILERVKIDNFYYNLNTSDYTAEVTSQNSSYPYWSTSITDANIPSSVKYDVVEYSVTSIGDKAFLDCESLTSVAIPSSVTEIGSGAFMNCTGLTSVTIPNGVVSLDASAFRGCSGLTSIEISNSVTSIGHNTFQGCSNLKFVTIGNSVTSIGMEAFSGCNSLTSVKIPNSVTTLWKFAFQNCSNLDTLYLGENIDFYGEKVFAGCPKLSAIYNYREHPASLGTDAFKNVDYFGCTLYVPEGSVDMYKSSGSDWKDFYYIEPLPESAKTYTIRFVNWDGTVLQSSPVEEGTMPVYNGEIPTRPETNDSIYTFVGWTPEIVAVTKDATYTATYKATSKQSDTHLEYDAENANFTENFSSYDIDESTVAQGYTWITATNNNRAAIQLLVIFPNGKTTLTAGTYPLDTTPYYQSVQAGQGVDENGYIVGSCAYYFNSKGNILTPIWFLVNGAMVVNEQGKIVINALNSYGRTISCQLENSSEAIDEVSADKPASSTKILRDGQILILRGDKTYTLTGQEVR